MVQASYLIGVRYRAAHTLSGLGSLLSLLIEFSLWQKNAFEGDRYDVLNPAWSGDNERIAYIMNFISTSKFHVELGNFLLLFLSLFCREKR